MENQTTLNFSDLNINASVMKAIQEMGFTEPSPIQAQALPVLLGEPTDFIGLAATGTGKTAAFSIPLLERIDPKLRAVQGLILCPTRELAIQVAGQIDLLGKHLNIRALPIYGGASYDPQIQGLKRGAMIVVGTPGRVIDHLDRGTLDLSKVSTLILDEADEMISMGFKDDLERVLESTPHGQSQTWLFSATMSPEVRRVADRYLTSPKSVQVNQKAMLSTTVEQIYYTTQESNKPEVLCKIIDSASDFYGIVFCQTKALVMDLCQYLSSRGYAVDSLHGDKSQFERERTLKAFRERKVKVMICTDVASRGIDVKDITHVINYSIPRELDVYVHRIGRTARSGQKGLAVSLVTGSHKGLVGQIERMTKTKMVEGKIPGRKEIGMIKVNAVLPKFQAAEQFARAVELLPEDWKLLLSTMTSEEAVGRFLVLQYPELFANQPAGKPIDVSPRSEGSRPQSNRPRFNNNRQDGDRPMGGRMNSDRPFSRGPSERPQFPRPRYLDKTSRPSEGGNDRGFGNDRPFGGDRPFARTPSRGFENDRGFEGERSGGFGERRFAADRNDRSDRGPRNRPKKRKGSV